MAKLELLTFRRSHFNEKARWALDYKGLAHTRTYLMPGPHAGTVKKRAPETTTPVLIIDDTDVVQGSRAILERIEALAPTPPLFPADRAADMEPLLHFFDEELGPDLRRVIFTGLINHNGYIASVFVDRNSKLEQWIYRRVLPLVKGKIARDMGVHDKALVAKSHETVSKALDLIAEKTAATGYLAGDSFTAADLTAAALMGPAIRISHPDMKLPEPEPDDVARMRDGWAVHPGAAWVLDIYAQHRPQPLA